MKLDELNAEWEGFAARPLAQTMRFDGGHLILGAGTVLAKANAPVDEAALTARLAAAHGYTADALPLGHVRRAVETWRKGDEALALTHLALSGLAKLARPKEDARRLFMADALIAAGIAPSEILEGLGLGPTLPATELERYRSDQSRVPPGNVDGGQWTRDGGIGTRTAERNFSVHFSSEPIQVAQVDLDQTCESFIAANCKGSIAREFPGQYLTCSLREILAAAKEGDRSAQKACKLLFRNRFRK